MIVVGATDGGIRLPLRILHRQRTTALSFLLVPVAGPLIVIFVAGASGDAEFSFLGDKAPQTLLHNFHGALLQRLPRGERSTSCTIAARRLVRFDFRRAVEGRILGLTARAAISTGSRSRICVVKPAKLAV